MSSGDVFIWVLLGVVVIGTPIAVWQYRAVAREEREGVAPREPAERTSRPVTPGRLLVWAFNTLLVAIALTIVGVVVSDEDSTFVTAVGYVAGGVIVTLVGIAAVAKAVQIGVRSSRD